VAYRNTWPLYNKNTEIIEDNGDDYEKAMELAKKKDKLPIGVIYQNREKPPFHKALHGEHHPLKKRMDRNKRLENLKNLLNSL
jgi:hypothetical protein